MFWNLWKYELKCSYRSYALMYGILLLSSFFLNTNSNFVSGIMMLIYGVTIVVTLIMTIVLTIRNYSQSMFSRCGYLTMTLPVSSKKLMLVKIINAFLWCVLSYLVVCISIFIIAIRVSNVLSMELIFEGFGELSKIIDFDFILFLANTTLSLVSLIVSIYAILNFTHSGYVKRHRGVIAIAIFVVFQIILSFIEEVIFGGTGSVGGVTSIFVSNGSLTLDFSSQMIFSIIQDSIIIVVCYFGACYLLDHKLEIE